MAFLSIAVFEDEIFERRKKFDCQLLTYSMCFPLVTPASDESNTITVVKWDEKIEIIRKPRKTIFLRSETGLEHAKIEKKLFLLFFNLSLASLKSSILRVQR